MEQAVEDSLFAAKLRGDEAFVAPLQVIGENIWYKHVLCKSKAVVSIWTNLSIKNSKFGWACGSGFGSDSLSFNVHFGPKIYFQLKMWIFDGSYVLLSGSKCEHIVLIYLPFSHADRSILWIFLKEKFIRYIQHQVIHITFIKFLCILAMCSWEFSVLHCQKNKFPTSDCNMSCIKFLQNFANQLWTSHSPEKYKPGVWRPQHDKIQKGCFWLLGHELWRQAFCVDGSECCLVTFQWWWKPLQLPFQKEKTSATRQTDLQSVVWPLYRFAQVSSSAAKNSRT